MHDIDNTQNEFEWETEAFGSEEPEFSGEFESEMEGPFSEDEEMELAAELLEVTSDQELEQFLGKLFKRVKRGVRRFARSKVGRFVGRGLRNIAKRALPIAGSAVGGFFGGPAGAAIGGRLASGAGRIFGLELEGLSPEDQEFEVARRFVRLAGEAVKNAADLDDPSADPARVAKEALSGAVRKHAPGLVSGSASSVSSGGSSGRTGRWIRRGRKIILMGA